MLTQCVPSVCKLVYKSVFKFGQYHHIQYLALQSTTLLSSLGRMGQNILKEFDDHHDEARYVGEILGQVLQMSFYIQSF